MNISEFLLSRIAEDEAAAREASTPDWPWTYDGGWQVGEPYAGIAQGCDAGQQVLPHIARWNPARVLAECEAKRRIVEREYRLSRKIRADDQRWLLEPFTNSDGRDCYRITYYDGAVVEMLERSFYEQHSDPLNELSPVLCLLALPYADHEQFQEEWRS